MAAGKVARLTLVIDGNPASGVKAVEQMQKQLQKLDTQTERNTRRAKSMRAEFGGLNRDLVGLAKNLAGGAIGIGGMAIAMRASIRNTIAQEKAITQMEAALASTNGVAGLTSKQLQDLAASLQNTSTFGDEAVIAMQSVLLTFTNLRGNVLKDATKAVVDISTRMGTDLTSAALQVGKALNDPIAGLGGLSRAGIQFSKSQKALIKDLTETGRVAEAQRMILSELETQFGGAAAAAADTFGGAIAQAQNALGDLLEADGGSLVEAKEAIQELTGVLQSKETKEAFAILTEGFVDLATSTSKGLVVLAEGIDTYRTLMANISEQKDEMNGLQRVLFELVPQYKAYKLVQAALATGTEREVEQLAALNGEASLWFDTVINGTGAVQLFGDSLEQTGEQAAITGVELLTFGQGTASVATATRELTQAEKDAAEAAAKRATAIAQAKAGIDAQLTQLNTQINLIESGIPIQEAATRASLMARGVDQDRIEELLRLTGVIDKHQQAQENAKASAEGLGDVTAGQATAFDSLRQSLIDTSTEWGAISATMVSGIDNIAAAFQAAGETGSTAFAATFKDAAKGWAQVTGGAAQFFNESSDGYKVLQAASEAFYAFEIAQQIASAVASVSASQTKAAGHSQAAVAAGTEAVATQASAGPYVGFALAAAMAAFLGSIGIRLGGGGGSAGGALDVGGKRRGNFEGTVLGDPEAASESIVNAIGQLEDITTVGLKYSEQMAASLLSIEQALTGVSSEFARVSQALGVQQLTISGVPGGGLQATTGIRGGDLFDASMLASRGIETNFGLEVVNERITGLVQLTFDDIGATLESAIGLLGGNVKAVSFQFRQLVEAVSLSVVEGADIDEAITALFSGIADSAAGIADNVLADIDLTQYQLVGEGLFETLVRVASGFEVVSTELGRIGLSLDGIDVEASENLIALFGGIDEFVSAQQDYIEAMYSDAEKLAIQQADLSRVFDSLGTAIPENVEAYRALVEAQNRNTESGRAMYAALVQAGPLFADVQDALNDAAEAAADFAADMADMASSLRRAQTGLAGGSVAAFDLGRLANQINAATSIEELVGLIPALQTALNAQYQEGIDGINAQTRAQQEANRAWLDGVTETANAAMDAQLDAINATKDAQLAAIDTQLDGLREQIQLGEAMRDQAQSLREFVEGIVRGQSQAQAQQGLTALITAARGGDLEAAGQITGAATTAIDFARATATSRVEFDREQNRILQQLTGAADVLGAADVPTQQLQALEDSREILEAGFDAQLEAAREQTDALLAGYQATAEAMNAQAEAYGQQQAEWLAQQLSGSFDFLLSALDEAQAGGDLDTIKADLIAAIGGTTQAVLQLQALQQLSDSNVTGVLDFMTRAVQDIAADGQLNATQGFDQVVSALYGLEQTTLLSADTSVQAVDYLNNALTDVLDDGFLNQTQGFADVAALLHLVNSTTALEASQGRAAIGVLEAALTDVIADGTLDTFSGLRGVINALAANGVDINALQSATQSGLGNVANTTASWLSLVNSTTGNGSNVVADYISNLIGTTDNGIGSTLSHLAWVAQNEGQTTHSVNAVYNQMAELLVQLRDSVGPRGASQNLLSINENMRQQMEETKNRLHTSGPAGGIGARIEYVRANASSIVEALNQAYGTSATRYAKGGVFTNQVVTSPTQFQLGLMGEAGPEAIMPLTRGPDGALGVQNFGDANRALVAEVRALRAEVAQLRASNEQGQDIQIRELQIHNKRERRYDGGTHKKVGTDVSSPVQVEIVEEVPA